MEQQVQQYMKNRPDNYKLRQCHNGHIIKGTIRATIGSYIALCWPWILVAAIWVLGYLKRPSVDAMYAFLLCIAVILLWGIWLRGFKVTLTDEFLEYRDGFYRVSKVPLENFSEMKHKWVKWKTLGRTLTIPRTAVVTKDGKTAFLINDKPFGNKDFHMIQDMLKNTLRRDARHCVSEASRDILDKNVF